MAIEQGLKGMCPEARKYVQTHNQQQLGCGLLKDGDPAIPAICIRKDQQDLAEVYAVQLFKCNDCSRQHW
jgi:hypothetical protein